MGLWNASRRRPRWNEGAVVFGYWVKDPERYGVVEFDADGRAVTIEEKPAAPRSNYAVPGLYFYDERVVDVAARLRLRRGGTGDHRREPPVPGVGRAHVEKLGRGIAWLDTGTHESLLQASNFIQTIEERQGLKVACLEEIAWRKGYIDAADLRELAATMAENSYRAYLHDLLRREA